MHVGLVLTAQAHVTLRKELPHIVDSRHRRTYAVRKTYNGLYRVHRVVRAGHYKGDGALCCRSVHHEPLITASREAGAKLFWVLSLFFIGKHIFRHGVY